ncbi:MAG: Fic family protein [Desulfobacteraceae bacterium]|nr:Fic family protein [Desulfobacteraceae bacterium]
MAARGLQELWTRQRPEILEALRQQAVVQSVESSNRIEGVTIATDRLKPVIIGKARPRDRSEEELAGYRKALDWIFSRKKGVAFSPEVVLKLHALAQGGMSGDAGQWKQKDNEIVEILPNGERRIRFTPTPAKKTPRTMGALCTAYSVIGEAEQFSPLLNIATAVFDLLCIHPFRDGNGRVSRLVTAFLLTQNGFNVCRFVSLERLVEERKEEYYRVLKQCSDGWHEGRNDISPWWIFFLSILRSAYIQFGRQVESKTAAAPKSDLVRHFISEKVGPFSIAEVAGQVPVASRQLIKKVLAEMKAEGLLEVTGKGRGAVWEVVGKR